MVPVLSSAGTGTILTSSLSGLVIYIRNFKVCATVTCVFQISSSSHSSRLLTSTCDSCLTFSLTNGNANRLTFSVYILHFLADPMANLIPHLYWEKQRMLTRWRSTTSFYSEDSTRFNKRLLLIVYGLLLRGSDLLGSFTNMFSLPNH